MARTFDGDVAVHVTDVSIRYVLPSERVSSFKEYTIRRLQRKIRTRELWALKDVSLQVAPGEIMGIVGRNGAGKSTLLRVIARILRPTKGRVRIRGKVAPLLEFGAGFHPELSGRENVFLNGAILGFSRSEIEERFEKIVDFAELWEFIDAPLRTYSKGMIARLGFAIATDIEPDILLVDEILAVGDEAFRRKCEDRMAGFRERGATILLVSHNMATVREMCRRAAWIEKGSLKAIGQADEVTRQYQLASVA